MGDATAPTGGAVTAAEKDRLRALFLLAITPAILLIAWINRYGVNVPFADEWVTVRIFEKWYNHQLTFADLYKQHNEHRILLPNLIYLAFAQLTNWNLRAEMFFSVALCGGTSAGIYALLRRTVGGSPRQLLLLWAAANLLIFSPTQAESWLLGFALHMFIPNVCVVITLLVLSSDWRWWAKFGASVLLIAAATLSFGNGLLLWPVVALFLWLRGESIWRIAAWLVAFGVAVALYFSDYHHLPRAQLVSGNWLDYPAYFLVLIGGALARQREGHLLLGAIVVGAAAVGIYGSAFLYFLWRRGEAVRNAAPWLALGAYVIGSAALAAYSRVNWGPQQAGNSRYVLVSSNLYLALIPLAVIALRDIQQRIPTSAGALGAAKTALITTIVVLTLAAFPAGLQEMAILQRDRLVGLAALQLSKGLDTTDAMRRYLQMLPGFAPVPLHEVAALERLKLLGYRRHGRTFKDAPQGGAPSKFGRADELQQRDPDTFEISGWAVLPKSDSAAPLVVLAYRRADHWVPFGFSEVGDYRPDVAARFHSRDYLPSGWRQTFSRKTLPAEATQISAWAVDPLRNKVHKLAGDRSLPEP